MLMKLHAMLSTIPMRTLFFLSLPFWLETAFLLNLRSMSGTAAGQSSAAAAVPGAEVQSKFFQFSTEELADAPKLEPALEAVLRAAKVDESIISLFRVREILDREDFVNLHSNEEGIRKLIADPDAIGVDPDKGFVHARERERILKR